MMDILSFVNGLQDLYLEQSDDFKALVKPPRIVQAKDFERYVINLYRYLDGESDRAEAENTLYEFLSAFMVDYDGAYLEFTLTKG